MQGPPVLSLVVPTLNEAAGIEAFLERLLAATAGLSAEILVLDDRSADGTAALASALLKAPHRVFVREGPPGLGRAVVEGWGHATGELLGVIDADLSHPPELLPSLLAAIDRGADLALATRYMPGGGTTGWPWRRRAASRLANALARTLVEARDPMSGFFVLRRRVLEGVDLDPTGWKIALEVLTKGSYREVCEVPYVFRDRVTGASKFGAQAIWDYLKHQARLRAHLAQRGRLRRGVSE